MTRKFPSLFTADCCSRWCGFVRRLGQGFRIRDRTPPTAPTNLVVTATTENSVSLAWGPSTDNSGSFSYIICCAGGTTVTVSQTVTSHTLEGLSLVRPIRFASTRRMPQGTFPVPATL